MNRDDESNYTVRPLTIEDIDQYNALLRYAFQVTEQELSEKREIPTNLGETLSWEYLCYVRRNPITWKVPTWILYGERDNLTPIETVSAFAEQHHAELTIMPGGEHWFHTEAQMQFLDHWIKKSESEAVPLDIP